MTEPMSDAPRPQDRAEHEPRRRTRRRCPNRTQVVRRRAAAGAADVVDTVTGLLKASQHLTERLVKRVHVERVRRMADSAVAVPTGKAPVPEPRARAVPRRAVLQRAAGAVDVVNAVAKRVTKRVERMADVAVQRWRNRQGARTRRLRSLNREPLPNVFEVYPDARDAARYELGLATIPVEEILGTAVEGPDQRGRDFLPLPAFRSRNWEGRWWRVRRAMAEFVTLPPIDVLKAGGGYWVEDGHNRVAAALYTGQLDMDAVVVVLRLPGDVVSDPAGSMAPLLAEAQEMRAAGMGSRMPTSSTGAVVAKENQTEVPPVHGGEVGALDTALASPERPVADP